MKRKYFSKIKEIQVPNLISNQIVSFDWLKKKGIKEVFEEISPIRNYAGNIEIHFGDYCFDEPKYSEKISLQKNITYEAPLKCEIELRDKTASAKATAVKQEIYLGDFPIMTCRSTFVINGVERVVVPQLIRSPGVFFTEKGAKIIPTRGAWLEMELVETRHGTSQIWVKIDKKRKIEAECLLRVFGSSDVNVPEDKAYIEIYRRLRPGDLATIDNAKSLIDNMFFNQERYDLGVIGRYMLNRRLSKLKIKNEKLKIKNSRILTKDDLEAIVSEIKRRANKEAADDIDNLANRRVKMVGELVQDRFRIGLIRMQRNISDKMSTMDIETITLSQIINGRPLVAVVKEFFASSQLSQFMDQVNPLAELEHKRRLSAMGPGGLTRERAGFEARDVHSSHYGRICPIQSSEGPNIGLVVYLSNYSRVNEYGFLETPYYRVKKGQITREIVYLDAYEEKKYTIAPAMVGNADLRSLQDLPLRLPARVHGQPKIVSRSKIDFIDVSSKQLISVSTSLIPFLEHDDGQRALMGSNMQRQAVSCVKPEAPVVGTGQEERAAIDSGQVVVAEEAGQVIEVDGEHIKIQNLKLKIQNYDLQGFMRSNADTCLTQRPIVKKGETVVKGQPIADGAATNDGELALGQNLLVAFMNWEGWNYEDAIVISQKIVKEDRFTSIHIEEFAIDVRDTKLGPELTTRDIPNIGEEKLRDLDNDGIIRLGAEVGSRDILVGKISPKGEKDLTAEERLLRAIFGEKARDIKDASLLLPYGKRGKVVDVKIFSREQGDRLPSGVIQRIQVCVAQLRSVAVGDKLAGRHGNKGVIAAIVPEENMPYLPDGRPVDIVLSPLGVVSRMNIGQILETHLGWAAQALGYKIACPAFNSASEATIKEELKRAGLPENGQIQLYDGRAGETFDHKTTVGIIYIMKLHHLVEDKIHMRSTGPYSLITQQPLGGKAQFGGQRFGEMEVWALEGYGAAYALQEMLTIKSDDILGRSKTYESIIKNEPIKAPSVPASFNVLVQELKALGLSVEVK